MWKRLAGASALVALLVPDGPYKWAALSIVAVALGIGLSRMPREVWTTHKLLIVALGCSIAAIWTSVLLPVSPGVTTWTVGLTGLVFVGVVVFSTVRLIRRNRKATDHHHH